MSAPATPMLIRAVRGGDYFAENDEAHNYFLARDLEKVELLTGQALVDGETALLVSIHGQLVGVFRWEVFYAVFEDEVDVERGRQLGRAAEIFLRTSKTAEGYRS